MFRSFARVVHYQARRKMATSASQETARHAIQNANAVCFDVDSTVISEEGIDVLAAHCGAGTAVAEWTSKAMNGGVLFQDALQARLDIIKPAKKDIYDCLEKHPLELTPGVEEFITKLHANGTHVYLVSGGFRMMIEPIADHLKISHDRIFANTILFDSEGAFKGFDADEPTSRDGGKSDVVAMLKETHGYSTVVMIGDGATDMQARPPADAFIGFGGIAVRESVRDGADWFVTDFSQLTDVLA